MRRMKLISNNRSSGWMRYCTACSHFENHFSSTRKYFDIGDYLYFYSRNLSWSHGYLFESEGT